MNPPNGPPNGASPPSTVVAIFGPTGVGKTAVAIELAELLRVEGENPIAISADALQVYAGLETLTGAATAQERARLEHRLVGFIPVTESFSVGAFMPLAHREIDAALTAGRRPVVVGGTGLYLRAALADLDLAPGPPPEVRERWQRELADRGPEALHEDLRARAPDVAAGIDPRDRTRIARALELDELGVLEAPEDRPQLWTSETRHPTLLAGLVHAREELYRRIDSRVEALVAAGAEEEVRRAHAAGASATARKALGFEELLRGDVEAMKRRTRNYAKRQLTWMRKLPRLTTIDVGEQGVTGAAQKIAARLRAYPNRGRRCGH